MIFMRRGLSMVRLVRELFLDDLPLLLLNLSGQSRQTLYNSALESLFNRVDQSPSPRNLAESQPTRIDDEAPTPSGSDRWEPGRREPLTLWKHQCL